MYDDTGDNDVDILSPQVREMYASLLDQGHYDDAAELKERALSGALEENHTGYEYLTQKTVTARNLLVHKAAMALEHFCCSGAKEPCSLCLGQARKIVPAIWGPIIATLKAMENRSQFTIYQLLEIFIKKTESDPGSLYDAVQTVHQHHLKIIKAPKVDSK